MTPTPPPPAVCPVCGHPTDIPPDTLHGDVIDCDACGAELVVTLTPTTVSRFTN